MSSIQTSTASFVPQYPTTSQPQASSVDADPVAAPALQPAATSADLSTLSNAQAKAGALSQTLQLANPTDPAYRDDRTLASQQFVNSLASLASTDTALTPEQRQQLQDELAATAAASPKVQAMQASVGSHFVSDADLWNAISIAIGNIEKDYLGVYENVVAQYTEFYQEFSKILAQMGGWITAGSSSDKVKLNVTALKNALQQLQNKFKLPSTDAILFPAKDANGNVTGVSREKAAEWAKELGLPDSCVKEQPAGSGKYVVVIDTGPVQTMIDELNKLGTPDSSGNVELDNAKFQAWQSGFKSQEESLKNTLQTLTQKYSNANSLYDNLVKVLSSTISACLETAKSFLNG